VESVTDTFQMRRESWSWPNLTTEAHNYRNSVEGRESLLDKGGIKVHHDAGDSVAMVKAHTIAMNLIALLLFAHQHHPAICRSFHRIAFPSAVVHTPVVVPAGPNPVHTKTWIHHFFHWLEIMLSVEKMFVITETLTMNSS
jgi:hypothetical protein